MAHHRRGYVLLLTLLLIPIAAVALASIERLSLSRALEASRAEQELQRRWLETSCRAAVMSEAPAILEKARLEKGTLSQSFMLPAGGYQVELIFTDEQAKPNVNLLWSTRDPQQCEDTLQQLMRGCSAQVMLRPTPPEMTGFDGAGQFGSFGQVFGTADPVILLGSPTDLDGAAARVTLWGSGKLNFHRATAVSLQAVCSPILGLGDIEKLLAVRADQPSVGTGKLLDQLQITKEQRADLIKRITDHSDCFGLWIIIRNSDSAWYSFAAGPIGGTIQRTNW